MSKLYRPSNGTEGMIFESRFCDRCIHDRDDDCDIHTRALLYDESDAEYPSEWQYGTDGRPLCVKFATEIPPPSRVELEGLGQVLPLASEPSAPLLNTEEAA